MRRYHQTRSKGPVVIPKECRETVGRTLINRLKELDHRVLVVSVAGMHAHLLVELPEDIKEVKTIFGECKRTASKAIRQSLPGRVWAGLGKFEAVDTAEHQRNVFNYILRQEDAWIWSFRDDDPGETLRLSPGLQEDADKPGDKRSVSPGSEQTT